MKKIFNILMTLGLVAGLASCSDNWKPASGDDGEGQVSLQSMGVEVSTGENVVSRATVDLSNFIVTITNDQGAQTAQWYYKDMPEIFTLPVGTYTVTVKNREVQKAAWDSPYYLGSKTFQITDGNITNVGVVTCTFANVRVSIQYSDQLREMLTDDVTVEVKCNEVGTLTFTPSETRSAYFEAVEGSTTMVVTFSGTLKGESAPVTLTKTYTDVTGGNHYIITYTVKDSDIEIPDEKGTVGLSNGLYLDSSIKIVGINGNIDDDDDPLGDDDRPGKEDPDSVPTPTPDPAGGPTFTFTDSSYKFDTPNSIGSGECVVIIESTVGLSHLIVNIKSTDQAFIDGLPGVGVPTTFDLAYPVDASEEAFFTSFGFPYGSDVIGAKQVRFDITDFVPLLAVYKESTHTFVITATDADNVSVTKSIIFYVP